MDKFDRSNRTKWDCKFHIVFIPKNRRKVLYGQLRVHLGDVFCALAQQNQSRIKEGHLMPDHVHMMISIPPKYAMSNVVGYIKGKVRFTWPVFMERKSRTLLGKAFGPEGTLFQRLADMSR